MTIVVTVIIADICPQRSRSAYQVRTVCATEDEAASSPLAMTYSCSGNSEHAVRHWYGFRRSPWGNAREWYWMEMVRSRH